MKYNQFCVKIIDKSESAFYGHIRGANQVKRALEHIVENIAMINAHKMPPGWAQILCWDNLFLTNDPQVHATSSSLKIGPDLCSLKLCLCSPIRKMRWLGHFNKINGSLTHRRQLCQICTFLKNFDIFFYVLDLTLTSQRCEFSIFSQDFAVNWSSSVPKWEKI